MSNPNVSDDDLRLLNEAMRRAENPDGNYVIRVDTYDHGLIEELRLVSLEGITQQERLQKAIHNEPEVIWLICTDLGLFLVALGKFFGYLTARESRIAKEQKAQEKTKRTVAKIRAKRDLAKIEAAIVKGIPGLDLSVEQDEGDAEEENGVDGTE